MMVAFDAGILINLFRTTGSQEEREKLSYLVADLERSKQVIVIPTPALSEFLIRASPNQLDEIRRRSAFRIAPFDQKAAIECALAVRDDLSRGGKRGVNTSTWAKAKF